jgi:hypothetical protein
MSLVINPHSPLWRPICLFLHHTCLLVPHICLYGTLYAFLAMAPHLPFGLHLPFSTPIPLTAKRDLSQRGEHISSLSNDTSYCSHLAGCDSILVNILFGHLRRMDHHPSLTATWRIVLAILASSQNFGLRKPKFDREALT